MAAKSVLVEYESAKDNETYTNSGLLFSDVYVFITGNVLMPYLKELNLNQWLSTLKPGLISFENSPPKSQPKLNVVSKQGAGSELEFKRAQIVAGFVCKNIASSCQKYLRDWAIDFENQQHRVRQFLALFFILKIEGSASDLGNESGRLNAALVELLNNARRCELSIGHEVFIESTPFGNRAFVDSYSQGVVSNVMGENSCFLLTDCPSAPGSEGSPVFLKTKSKEKCVIGIVISCLNWWKGEWVGLTLAANLVPLLSQVVPINSQKAPLVKNPTCSGINVSKELQEAVAQSLVQIISGSGWGTGILLNKNKGIFLTNSHVIASDDNVVLHCQNQQMKASVVYKTPNFDVYDLAILRCNSAIVKKLAMSEASICLKRAEIGEDVFAAGYSLFSRELNPKPSLTKGHVSQVHGAMIKTTCTVLPGASGGAIFRPNGRLLAVIVSNTKMEDVGVVYPRINMCIPILAVYAVIEKYLQTGDAGHLKGVHTSDPSSLRQWNFLSGKL